MDFASRHGVVNASFNRQNHEPVLGDAVGVAQTNDGNFVIVLRFVTGERCELFELGPGAIVIVHPAVILRQLIARLDIGRMGLGPPLKQSDRALCAVDGGRARLPRGPADSIELGPRLPAGGDAERETFP